MVCFYYYFEYYHCDYYSHKYFYLTSIFSRLTINKVGPLMYISQKVDPWSMIHSWPESLSVLWTTLDHWSVQFSYYFPENFVLSCYWLKAMLPVNLCTKHSLLQNPAKLN